MSLPSPTYLRIIGDVHGKLESYIQLAKGAQYSIQLGDLGFSYNAVVKNLDPERHRVLGGNHDNYESVDGEFMNQPPHFLGDHGTHVVPNFGEFFFVRGGHSIDKDSREDGIDWWAAEQLTYADALLALSDYKDAEPELMLSHECPVSIIDMIAGFKTWNGQPIRPSMTAQLLEQMFDAHKPKLWIFGHHHKAFDMTVDGTRFVCLPELACMDFEQGTQS